ncbi:MAG: hypothetical protein ACI8ZW_000063 [Yoonia sp.]
MVPLDFAKLTHYACFCDGRGRYIRNAFTVKNNRAGIDYLIEQIERTRKARSIRSKQHVIIGGEDSASYTCNFMDELFKQGYLTTWLRVDQHETDSEERAQYILQTWPDLLLKWKRLGLHQEAFAPEAPLGQWREIVQEIYDIELPL